MWTFFSWLPKVDADSINAAASIEQKLAGRSLFPAPSPSAPFARQRQIDRHVHFSVIRPRPTVMQSSTSVLLYDYRTTTVLLLYYYCATVLLLYYYKSCNFTSRSSVRPRQSMGRVACGA